MKAVLSILMISPDPQREKQKRLKQAELDLIQCEANREYYNSASTMLKARIERLKGELLSDQRLAMRGQASAQASSHASVPSIGSLGGTRAF